LVGPWFGYWLELYIYDIYDLRIFYDLSTVTIFQIFSANSQRFIYDKGKNWVCKKSNNSQVFDDVKTKTIFMNICHKAAIFNPFFWRSRRIGGNDFNINFIHQET